MSTREDNARVLAERDGLKWDDMRPTERDVYRKVAPNDDPIRPNVGDAKAEVTDAMRGRLDDLSALHRIVDGHADEFSNDELLALGIGYGQPGALSAEQVSEEAMERVDEYPLAVEATTTFEIVLGTGGPDDRLCFECNRWPGTEGSRDTYEIQRISYRYSWTGSAEVELTGEDADAAERFARQVVPELSE